MIRTLLISFLTLFLTERTSSQCVISVPSTTGYTVNITLTPTSIVAPSLCLNGYNYNVAINYAITFTGSNIPRRLYTLQATLGCGASSHFFSLPKSTAAGSLVTQSNVWTTNTNCATATLASFGCNTFNLTIEGPGIPQQVISCNLPVPCRAGNNAPALSASTRSNVCPATTANLSTITASNTPVGAVLQWHTATPATAANKVALPGAVSAGNYYAVFYDALANCYSPASAAVPVTIASCCQAGTAAPALSATTRSNVCPATTANLSTITASNTPVGALLQWHTATPATAANKVALPGAVSAGNYYAVFYDAINNCYSPASASVTVTIATCCQAGTAAPALSANATVNLCPLLSADLTTMTASNTPIGAVLEWHTSATASAATKVNLPTSVSAGVYFAVFHDPINNCYSSATSVTANVAPCCNAGTSAPILTETSVVNVCPLTTASLTSITASNMPFGTSLQFHTSATISATTQMTALTTVNSGVYFAVFFDVLNNCYSSTTTVDVAINTCNITGITSGNEGGLESDGCLAEAIAQRNYSRIKTPEVAGFDPSVSGGGKLINYDNPRELQMFVEPTRNSLQTRGDKELESFIPQKPFSVATTPYISTPNDLLGITNAKKVLSVDYFDNASNRRLAAILSTKTQEKVYDHTKVICDRLIGSQLLKTEKVIIDNKPFILSVLQRENGSVEYNINFSVNQENATTVLVTSQWAIDAYLVKPDYWNYQVWAESPTLVKKLALEILNKFKEQFATLNSTVEPSIPQVFVKKGSYDNGVLTLHIQNPIGAKQITLTGNYTGSETQKREVLNKTVALSGAKEETVEVYVGSVFDMGFLMKNNKAPEYDALYFADGAWGLDYNKNVSKVDQYEVNNSVPNAQNGVYSVERSPILRGVVKDYISLFRSLRPASVEADMSNYKNLSFTASGSSIVEVTLVKKSIKDWSKQYRSEVRLFSDKQDYVLALKDFSNGTSEPINADDLVDVVFTIKGDGKTEKAFDMTIENLAFDNKSFERIPVADGALKAFPNPASELTELIFDMTERSMAQISLSNFQGRQIVVRNEELAKGRNRIALPVNNLPSGMYVVSIITAKGKISTKVIVP